MGNVLASETKRPTDSTVSANQISSATPTIESAYESSDINSEMKTFLNDKTSTIEQDNANPGTFEELHKMCKEEVFPVVFEGVKVLLNKNLSNHFQVSHTINLSTISQSGYRFGAVYVGTKQTSQKEFYPVLLGNIDLNGNLNGQIYHSLGQKTTLKFAAEIQDNKYTASQFSLDFKGNDHTVTLALGNPDVINMTGVAICHYLQNVTPNLALGAGLVVHSGRGSIFPDVSAGGRYSTEDAAISGKIDHKSIHLSYYQRASKQAQIGVELETNSTAQKSVTTFGYQINNPKTDMCFRGMINSNWIIGAVFEKKLSPLPFNYALSASMNYNNNKFYLGCGLII